MRQPFLVLSRSEIEKLISFRDAIAAVEEAFVSLARGEASLFPVIREPVNPYGGFFGVKAGHLPSRNCLGYKGGGFWAGNPARGLAGHQSVILLYDPETGVPRAALDGNYITVIRTGAAGAIAARLLARPDSRIAAVIGSGVQGEIQLRALREVLPIEELRCFDANPAAAEQFALAPASGGLKARACGSAREAVEGADVVVTATPSFEPVIEESWIQPGTHISAFGADTAGKHELDTQLVVRATRVADYLAQSREIGEFQHAFREGLVNSVHAELGEVLVGLKPGRRSKHEITVFDATGIALQDLAVAARALAVAQVVGVGVEVMLD